MAAMTLIEFAWWWIAWSRGLAPSPFVGIYLMLAFGAVVITLGLRKVVRRDRKLPSWAAIFAGTALAGIGASLFLPLKTAIPKEIPFWLDRPLALAERNAFGADPWLLLDRAIGWLAVPVDHLYALWLPVQSLVLFAVMLESPSSRKSRALIAYSLAWFLLGVAAATLFSSAGPLFYDRLFGDNEFGLLSETLTNRGVWLALAESNKMYAAIVSKEPSFVSGISALPSMHVAISLWIYLTARSLAPRTAKLAFIYTLFIWVASVQLGWHYVADGLAGAAGMVAVWALAGTIERLLDRPSSGGCAKAS